MSIKTFIYGHKIQMTERVYGGNGQHQGEQLSYLMGAWSRTAPLAGQMDPAEVIWASG